MVVLGIMGGVLTFGVGIFYLNRRRKAAKLRGKGYGKNHRNDLGIIDYESTPSIYLAVLPLILVAVGNKLFGELIESTVAV